MVNNLFAIFALGPKEITGLRFAHIVKERLFESKVTPSMRKDRGMGVLQMKPRKCSKQAHYNKVAQKF